MIGRMLEDLMYFIKMCLEYIGDFFYRVFARLFELLGDLFRWLGQLLERLFQALIDVLVSFFTVIYDLIRALLYLIYMIGVLAVKLFTVLWELGKLIWSFIVGISKTIASLFYTERTSGGHGYSEMMGKVVSSMDVLQLDVVAYILLFLIWVMTAFGVMSVISSLKNL